MVYGCDARPVKFPDLSGTPFGRFNRAGFVTLTVTQINQQKLDINPRINFKILLYVDI